MRSLQNKSFFISISISLLLLILLVDIFYRIKGERFEEESESGEVKCDAYVELHPKPTRRER